MLLASIGCADSTILAPEFPGHGLKLSTEASDTSQASLADFSYMCTGIVCEFFTVNIQSKSAKWDFGHDAFGETPDVHHTFPAAGKSYTVRLDLVDLFDRTHVVQRNVNILDLNAVAVRVRGVKGGSLTWAPAEGDLDIVRDGVIVKVLSAASNRGMWIDLTESRKQERLTWQVCDHGTRNCSNMATTGH